MKQRVITATVLVAILGTLAYFGEDNLSFLFSGLCVLLSIGAAYEFTRMSRTGKGMRWFDYIAVFMTGLFSSLSVLYFDLAIGFLYYIVIFLIGTILLYTILFLFIKDFTREDFGNHLLTIFYTGFGFIAFAYLRARPDIGGVVDAGLKYIAYLFVVTMLTDMFAYLIGIKFGKHRLAEKISPKKSIEGAIAGLVFGALSGAFFGYYLEVFDMSFISILALSAGLSCISQIGDLIASKFKREAGIKDYSNLFPGHGGILDRFDSSMFAAIFLMLAEMIIF